MFKGKIWQMLVAALAITALFAACDDDGMGPDKKKSGLRVIHGSYDAPNVDVWVDGGKAFTDVAYGASSGYGQVDAGLRKIAVVPTGQTSPEVISAELTLASATDYTVFALNQLSAIEPLLAVDDRDPVSDKALVRFLHGSPDAPAVDIKLNAGDGPTVFGNRAFKSITDYAPVDGGAYTFVVTAAGSTTPVVTFEPITVSAGTVYTVAAWGTLDDTDAYPFFVRVYVDNDEGTAFVDLVPAVAPTANVRVIHTSYDAPNVDVAVDGGTAITNLAYGQSSGYAELEAGMRDIKVFPTGTTTPAVIDVNLDLTANTDYTVFAVNEVAAIEPIFTAEDRSPDPTMAKVRFVHASPDAPAVDIKLNDGSGPVVFGNKAFKSISDYTMVAGGAYTFVVTGTGSTTPVVTFNPVTVTAGTVYTVVAHGTLDDTDAYPFAVRVFVDNDPGSAFVDLTVAMP